MTTQPELDRADTELSLYVEQLPAAPDQILLLRGRIAEIKQRATEMLKTIDEQVMVPWVKSHGQIEVAPGVKWVLKYEKTIKPKDLRRAIEGIFLAVNGDFDSFVQALSVNAIKPGEAKKLLGDSFDEFFSTVIKEDVELKEPKRKLSLVDERFLK